VNATAATASAALEATPLRHITALLARNLADAGGAYLVNVSSHAVEGPASVATTTTRARRIPPAGVRSPVEALSAPVFAGLVASILAAACCVLLGLGCIHYKRSERASGRGHERDVADDDDFIAPDEYHPPTRPNHVYHSTAHDHGMLFAESQQANQIYNMYTEASSRLIKISRTMNFAPPYPSSQRTPTNFSTNL